MNTYTAVAPNGETFTRKTNRTYTHAVAVSRNGVDDWKVETWCGRLDLAQKQVKNYTSGYDGYFKERYPNSRVEIVEVS